MSTRNVSPALDVTTPMTLSPRAGVYCNKQHSSVASPAFDARRGTKLGENSLKGDTQKYCEIHAVNSDKAIDLYTLFLDWQPHEVECQSLCGSEVTPEKLNGGGGYIYCSHVPQCRMSALSLDFDEVPDHVFVFYVYFSFYVCIACTAATAYQ